MFQKNIYRVLNLSIVVALTLAAVAVVHAASTPVVSQATSLTFKPVADAYVIQTYPSNNFGSANNLRVDSSPVTRSYLRFTVSGLAGRSVQSVTLRIYAKSTNSSGFAVHPVANSTWTETGITYSNAPTMGSAIANSKPISARTWVSVNVTSYVKVDGTYSMALDTTSATNTSLSSREASTNAPQLVVTLVPLATATATLLPTKTIAATPTPATTNTPVATPTSSGGTSWQPSFPIRAAFYYPWFPEAWTQKGIYPYTNYTPKLGYYSSTDQAILKQHIAMMQYGNIQAGIASWWGQGSQTDSKIAGLLTAAGRNELPLGALL